MKPDRPIILSILFLAGGLALIFGYAKGIAGLSAAYPISNSTLHIDVNTGGLAALGGISLLGIGVLLLLWSLLAAIVSQLMLLGGGSSESRRSRSYSILANDEDDVPVARSAGRSSFLGLESVRPVAGNDSHEAATASSGIDAGAAQLSGH